jgi:hypothetical protein
MRLLAKRNSDAIFDLNTVRIKYESCFRGERTVMGLFESSDHFCRVHRFLESRPGPVHACGVRADAAIILVVEL